MSAFQAIADHTAASFCWTDAGQFVALAARWTRCSSHADILIFSFSILYLVLEAR